jgi:hypothetical protein
VLEVREEDARRDDGLEAEPTAHEHPLQVFHHLARLRLDTFRVRRAVGGAAERHLAGDEYPAVDLDGMAERRYRIGRAANPVEK